MALTKPYSLQAERAVLGTAILDQKQVSLIADVLSEDDFYVDINKRVFGAIKRLHDDGVNVDVTSVADYLTNTNELDIVGGLSELVSLTESVVSDNIHYYINLLQDKTNLRNLSALLQESCDKFDQDSTKDINEYLNEFERKTLQITRNRHFEDLKSTVDLIQEYRNRIYSNNGHKNGLTTGFRYLDDKFNGGWLNGKLYVLGARPGVGKTAIALNMAYNTARKEHCNILYFSLEMSGEELIARLISSSSNIDAKKVSTLDIKTNDDILRVDRAAGELKNLHIYIDDTPSLSLADFEKKVRLKAKEMGNIGLVIVDYMQILQVKAGKNDTAENIVATISKSLKALARDANVPILALAQLNRTSVVKQDFKGEAKDDKEPQISDLRGSGHIEQDADVIMLLHRPNAFRTKEESEQPHEAKLLIKKNRDGAIGSMNLVYTPKFVKFESMQS